jgi:MoaD family protein
LVKIIFSSIIAKATQGEREVILTASTLRDALNQLVTRYGDPFKKRILDESGNPKRFLNFYVNGKNAHFLKYLDTPLNEKDEVSVLPSVTGG